MVLPFATTEFGGGLFAGWGSGFAGPPPATGGDFEGLEPTGGLGGFWLLLGSMGGSCAPGPTELTLFGLEGGLGFG